MLSWNRACGDAESHCARSGRVGFATEAFAGVVSTVAWCGLDHRSVLLLIPDYTLHTLVVVDAR